MNTIDLAQFTTTQLEDFVIYERAQRGWSNNSLAYDLGMTAAANSVDGEYDDDGDERDFEAIGEAVLAELEERTGWRVVA